MDFETIILHVLILKVILIIYFTKLKKIKASWLFFSL